MNPTMKSYLKSKRNGISFPMTLWWLTSATATMSSYVAPRPLIDTGRIREVLIIPSWAYSLTMGH
jgi:hypothetical protein